MSSWSVRIGQQSRSARFGQTKTPTTDFDLDGDPEGTHTHTISARGREATSVCL
jgi:hypothetical protein